MMRIVNFIAVALLLIASGFYGLRAFQYHLRIIRSDNLLEYREGAQVITSDLLARGESPYDPGKQPLYVNAYGLLYPLLGAPLVRMFGLQLEPFRLLSAFFIWCSLALLAIAVKRKGVSLVLIFPGVVIWYSTLLYGVTPLVRPDSLGTSLYLCSVLIPYVLNYSNKSMVAAILAGLAAFFTKPYFVLGIPIILSFIFLFVSKPRALICGCIFISILITLWILVCQTQVFYFHNTIYINMNAVTDLLYCAIDQLRKFIAKNYGLIILLLSGLAFSLKNGLKLSEMKEAMLPVFGLIVTVLVIYFKLGRHDGAYMTYLFQLISPFLILSALIVGSISKYPSFLMSLLLVLNLYSTFAFLPGFDCADKDAWQQLESTVQEHDKILAPAPLALMTMKYGKEVYDTGMTEYFQMNRSKVPPRWMYVDGHLLVHKLDSFKQVINDKLQGKEFDSVIKVRGNGPPFVNEEMLHANYTVESTIDLCMPHTLQRWTFDIFVPLRER